MKQLGDATEAELVLHWLSSEWYRLPGPADKRLITDSGPGALTRHHERLALLRSIRSPILDELPLDGRLTWVDIEPHDLAQLFIIPCFDWYLDTGSTFRLTDTLSSMRAGRGNVWEPGYVDNRARTDRVAPYIRRYAADTTDEVLIVIAVDAGGPYTIVDGTHRAAALYEAHQTTPNMPWRAILLRDTRVLATQWHVGSARAQANMLAFASYEASHQIW
jgi:hypothetical protein